MTNIIEIKFGYWPQKLHIHSSNIQAEPLPEFEDVVSKVSGSSQVDGSWFYPDFQKTLPAYQIPPTHVLHIANEANGRELGELAIAVIGLLEGMRLIPEEWVHFYRAAIKLHTLSDLSCGKGEIEEVLQITQTFWKLNHAQDIRRCLFGAIHWLLFSESYIHEFERFAAQYIVLDSCFWLHKNIRGVPPGGMSHAARPSFLARAYGIPEPNWATMLPDNTCELSRLRNEFFHEGRYCGHPIGFALSPLIPPITLQLNAFNTRLILGILGVNCNYLKSPVDTRAMHDLGLTKP
ncbi:MAG: hypothetical protein M0P73_02415 [Syntrophobacterales bacterium]|jgi:hypothetical protein|nr:hypothetical protein [Syntrophobacterales bacterium]